MSLPVPSAEVCETHTVSVACIGGHFSEDAFIEARAEFDWLDAWLDPPSIVDDTVTGARDEAVVRVGRSELTRAEIVGGTVGLITGVAGREGPSAVHLDRWSAVSIDLKEPQPWLTILDSWVRPFHDLLTISIGRPVRLTELRLGPADSFGQVFVDLANTRPVGVPVSVRGLREVTGRPTSSTACKAYSVDRASLPGPFPGSWRRW